MIEVTNAARLSEAAAQTQRRYVQKETAGGSFREVYQGTAESMDDIFEEAAARYHISVDLLKAVAKAESNFNPKAVSRAGALGVMQLMPATASALGVSDPFDARQNIMGGAKYLKTNLERYDGDVSLALAAYNAGPGSVAKYGGVPPYAETQNYVKKVASYMEGAPLLAGTFLNGSQGMTGSLGSSSATETGGLSSSVGSMYGASSYGSSYGNLYGTSDLAGLGGAYGASALTGMGSLFGMSSVYGSSADLLNLLLGAAVRRKEEDGELPDRDSLYDLVEVMKLQLLMNVNNQAGTITI